MSTISGRFDQLPTNASEDIFYRNLSTTFRQMVFTESQTLTKVGLSENSGKYPLLTNYR